MDILGKENIKTILKTSFIFTRRNMIINIIIYKHDASPIIY